LLRAPEVAVAGESIGKSNSLWRFCRGCSVLAEELEEMGYLPGQGRAEGRPDPAGIQDHTFY
jgi:hypothetical protein